MPRHEPPAWLRRLWLDARVTSLALERAAQLAVETNSSVDVVVDAALRTVDAFDIKQQLKADREDAEMWRRMK